MSAQGKKELTRKRRGKGAKDKDPDAGKKIMSGRNGEEIKKTASNEE